MFHLFTPSWQVLVRFHEGEQLEGFLGCLGQAASYAQKKVGRGF
jgi:hypothetical protein